MNYRHAFHAGNFADVFKHAVLALLLKSLARKQAPYCYLDTHAGAGRYDLLGEAAQKTGEYRDGIGRLWGTPALPGLEDYLAAVRALNPSGMLRNYPGSPAIARLLLRAEDRMVLIERHPQEYERLRAEFAGDHRVTVRQQDGYAALKAFLPPPQRRGLVLIDPPYESPEDFEQAFESLQLARARWASGAYALWYPIKDPVPVERLHRRLVRSGLRKLLVAELSPYPADSPLRLNGSGLVLVNPPWQLDQVLAALLPRLLERLHQHPGGRAVSFWLVPE
jgi:23S rRNA (adenine2030-N6)-methyltransferase